MTLYRVRFELCSAIVTPLKGDTIWGHIVWGIANNEGDMAVAAFLEQEKSDSPALVVSSAFPAGMVCRPLPAPEEPDSNMDINKYSEIKKKKKIKYVSASKYFIEKENLKDKTDTPKEVKENPFQVVLVMRNTIDRASNTVTEDGLYTTEEKWPGILRGNTYEKINWDLYILSSFDIDRVKQLVEWAFENGYGADASTGKGKIKLIGDPVPVETKKPGNTFMALGPFAYPMKNIKNIRADIFVRSGKISGAFAASLSPYKKPVILFDEGAVFECNEPIKHAGILLEKMHGEDGRICQSGFAPVIPV
jgi:CRISPR-associated protein Csm4